MSNSYGNDGNGSEAAVQRRSSNSANGALVVGVERLDRAPGSRNGEIVTEIGALVEEYFALEPADMSTDYPLATSLYGAREVVGALEALLSRNVTMGPRVRAFERAFAAYLGSKHALMVNSGSSANLLALSSLAAPTIPASLQPGDEVIVPAVGWSTSVAPILQIGCVPVFVDVDPRTLNLRPEELEAAWSSRTRAVMPVHLLGNPVDMDAVTEFAEARQLWVVEDACEALGTTIGGRRAGGVGHLGTFSFYFSHQITTVEGGMLVTDDDALANVARSMRTHGWTRDMDDRQEVEKANPDIDPRFLFAHRGFNLRPMETQAAFGLVQLERLESFNAARRRFAARLSAGLRDLTGELDLIVEQPGGESTWFGFAVITKDGDTRQRLSRYLEDRGVETRPVVAGNLAAQPAFRRGPHRTVGELPGACLVAERGLYIGNHPGLDDRRVDHAIEVFHAFFDRN